MTILAPAVELSQRDAPDADNWEFCGETDVASVLQKFGKTPSIEDVAVYLRNKYGESGVRMGTNSNELVDALSNFGLASHEVWGNTRAFIDSALANNHTVILAIYSDGLGNPGTRHTGHWVQVWGRDETNYYVMNSLGSPVFGKNHQYSLSLIETNTQGVGIEIDQADHRQEVVPVPISIMDARGIEVTPSGNGYYVFEANGGVFPFGDAKQGLGSLGGTHLNAPVVGMAVRPQNDGFWLACSDGGVFPFGAAKGFGSLGNQHLNAPIVGIATSPLGNGYILVGADGGTFTFGDAKGEGSVPGIKT